MSIDTLDKLSDKRCMSIKNAPPKWKLISEKARECGAGDWAMRKWLERKNIPAEWKIKIIEKSRGRIKLHDMEIVEPVESAESAA